MNMPSMIPVIIPTKNKSFFKRLWIWRFSVRHWKIAENWEYILPNGTKIVIPENFVFDGASIPKPLWSLLSPVAILLIPGLLHDFGYRFDYLWAITEGGFFYKYGLDAGKKFWDLLFKKVAIEVNGTICIDFVAWLAIKLFGWMAWRANRRRNADEIRPMKLGYNLNFKKNTKPEDNPMEFL